MLKVAEQEGAVMTLRKRLSQRAYIREVKVECVLAELKRQRRLHGTGTGHDQGFRGGGLAKRARGRFSSNRHSLGR